MPQKESTRVNEINAEIKTLSKEGERIVAMLEGLKTQYDKKLISKHHFNRAVEDAKKRLMQIDAKIPLLIEEKDRLMPSSDGAPENAEVKKEKLPFKAETPVLATPDAGVGIDPGGLKSQTEENEKMIKELGDGLNKVSRSLEELNSAVKKLEKGLSELPPKSSVGVDPKDASGGPSKLELEKFKIGLDARIRSLEKKTSELQKKVEGRLQ
jgi:uncharacterized coiled-coil DUF342 family protein